MKITHEELNIYVVEELYKELLQSFQKGDVSIDMQNVIKIDMSAIQLFVSLYKSTKNSSADFILQNVNEEIQKTLQTCACDFLLKASNE